jgi:hypothetical protein
MTAEDTRMTEPTAPGEVSETAVSLAAHEATIERGLTTFVEVGEALLAIRDERLYRDSHGTFEEYCRERWGFSDSRARQLIGAAQTVTNVTAAGLPAPSNEAQARELSRIPEEDRADVWAKAVEQTGGKPTAAAVRDAYRPAPASTEPQPSVKPERPAPAAEFLPAPEPVAPHQFQEPAPSVEHGGSTPAPQPVRDYDEPEPSSVEPADGQDLAASREQVAAKLAEIQESGPEMRRLRIRASFMSWLRGVGPFDVDPAEMAGLLGDDNEWAMVQRRRDDVTAYLDALLQARPRGLRVVGDTNA